MKKTKHKVKAPYLIRVPFEIGSTNNNDIDDRKYYLISIKGKWYTGKFEKKTFGWFFNGVYDYGYRLSEPDIDAIFEIKERK